MPYEPLEVVRALHRPIDGEVFDMLTGQNVLPVKVCAHCEVQDPDDVDEETTGYTAETNQLHRRYPCPTIQALDGKLTTEQAVSWSDRRKDRD